MQSTPQQLAIVTNAYNNQYLFSDHYLDHILPQDPRWDEGLAAAQDFLTWLRDLEARERAHLAAYSEAQLEEHWFRPIFERLGHVYEPQPSVPGLGQGVRMPDYVFFPTEAARQEAVDAQRTEAYAQHALAVGEVKAWDVHLSRKRSGKQRGDTSFERQNPSFQIDYYLKATGLTWGILSNGRRWRLVHRETSYRLDTYYEVDLAAILALEDAQAAQALRYFVPFFRQAAFRPDAQGRVFLDDVLAGSNAYAVALEEDLQENAYRALEQLMQGFLDFTPNRLGAEDLREIYENSLYLLYRLLFILYGESRGLLPVDNPRYRKVYGFERLREEITGVVDAGAFVARRSSMYYDKLRSLFHLINGDDPEFNEELRVVRYNGGLFDPVQHPFLVEKSVGDRAFVHAVDLLCRRETGPDDKEFADYRTLDVRHLGSIYEGLLEYQPRLATERMVAVRDGNGEQWLPEAQAPAGAKVTDRRAAGRVYLETDKGERKATGSYYTPQYIVAYIVEQTLGPLVEEALAAVKATEIAEAAAGRAFSERVLALKVLDPAMGSGHFLVEATDYLARALATDPYVEAEGAEGAAGAESDLNHWRRRVVERCIYGVDKNPLAVELAKLSLWLHTFAGDKPLGFLDHHLRCGDSLVGARVEDLGWPPPPVLSKKAQKQVEQQKAGQINMFGYMLSQKLPVVMGRILEIAEQESDDYDTVRAKEAANRAVQELKAPFKAVADLWTSAYFGNEFINGTYREALDMVSQPDKLLALKAVQQAQAIAEERRFFHWELAFPEVYFDRVGQPLEKDAQGFDAVVGNPPYGDILSQANKEFLIQTTGLKTGGRSDIYANFTAKSVKVLREMGQLGFIIPNTLIDGAQFEVFREHLTQQATVKIIRDFRNRLVFAEADIITMILIMVKTSMSEPYMIPYEYWEHTINDFETESMIIDPGYSEPWRVTNKVLQRLEDPGLYVALDPNIGTCHDAGIDYKWKNVGWQNRGNRQPISELILYSGTKQDSRDFSVLKGGDIDRYQLDFGDTYLVHNFEDFKTAENVIQVYLEFAFLSAKILTRQTSDRLQAVLDYDRYVTAKSIHTTLVKSDGYSEKYVLSLLNSRLLTYVYQARTGEVGRAFAQVKLYDLRELPIRRIDFATPAEERAALVEQAIAHYEAAIQPSNIHHPTPAALLTFTADQPADVVHDLLAHLAERMMALNRDKQQRVDAFYLDLEGVTDADTFAKLQKGKQGRTLWRAEACRPFVEEGSYTTHSLEESLGWTEDCYKVFVKKLAGSVSRLSEVVRVYRTHAPAYHALVARIAATDHLIDRIVYQLYGLTEEEIAIVEGEA